MLRNIFKSPAQMIFTPQIAWEYVSVRRGTNLYKGFLLPLWIIIIVAAFIGGCFVSANSSFEQGLKNLITETFVLFVGFHVSSFLLNEYTNKLTGIEKGLKNAQVFVAYSSSLIYLIAIIVSILPDFFFLWLFSIYTFFIVYVGAEIYYKVTVDKRTNFMLVTTFIILGTPMILRWFLSIMMTE